MSDEKLSGDVQFLRALAPAVGGARLVKIASRLEALATAVKLHEQLDEEMLLRVKELEEAAKCSSTTIA